MAIVEGMLRCVDGTGTRRANDRPTQVIAVAGPASRLSARSQGGCSNAS